jgi:prefoldin subunit 5
MTRKRDLLILQDRLDKKISKLENDLEDAKYQRKRIDDQLRQLMEEEKNADY